VRTSSPSVARLATPRDVAVLVGSLRKPEAYVGGAAKLFDEQGNLSNPATRDFLRAFGDAFARWVERQLAS
jgi:chromate reductase, NAD(P)H dehydrogenase (quinone)